MRKIDIEAYERRKSAIVEAARDCFSESGLACGVSEICARAKISPGHLYHYFSSKGEIIRAVVHASTAAVTLAFKAHLQRQDLFNSIVDLGAMAEISNQAWRVSSGLRLEIIAAAERDPGLLGEITAQLLAMKEMIVETACIAQAEGRLSKNLDPAMLADVASVLWSGVPVIKIIDPSLPPEAYASSLRALVALWGQPEAGPK